MGDRELDNEQILAVFAVLILAGLAWARRGRWMPGVARWLQENDILAAPGQGLVEVGSLGSLDAARLAVLACAVVLLGVLGSLERRRRRRQTVRDLTDV